MSENQAEQSHTMSKTAVIVVTACTVLATLMQALDSTIANVALPYMQGSVSASQDQINWVLTSYIVAAAIMTAPVGYLAGRFGRTRLFTVSIIGFTITSILCGLSETLAQIVLCRFLQGMFGAALVPLSQSVLFDIFPVERRGSAMALWGIGVQIGPVLGPILGGWLTEEYNWRWVFYINVPFGIVAAIGLMLCLKETPRNKAMKLDWLGFGALSLAIGAFQMLLDRGETLDWFNSPEIILEASIAGIAFYVFLVQFWLAPKGFLSPRLFTDLNFVMGLVFIFLIGLLLFATLALMAPYLQTLMNYPVVTAGICLAPRGIGTMLAMLLCGRLVGKMDVRILFAIGFGASAFVLYRMSAWTPDVSESAIIGTGILQGFGIGFVFVPLSVTSFATLPVALRTEATGIFSLIRNLGSSIGISITSSLLLTNTHINHAIIAAAVTPFSRALQTGAAHHYWNPGSPAGAAALDAVITRQATIIAYADDFRLMLLLSLLALPMILLIRMPSSAAPAR